MWLHYAYLGSFKSLLEYQTATWMIDLVWSRQSDKMACVMGIHGKHKMPGERWLNAGPASAALPHHLPNAGRRRPRFCVMFPCDHFVFNRQTRHVLDVGPTLAQHWVSVSCLLDTDWGRRGVTWFNMAHSAIRPPRLIRKIVWSEIIRLGKF